MYVLILNVITAGQLPDNANGVSFEHVVIVFSWCPYFICHVIVWLYVFMSRSAGVIQWVCMYVSCACMNGFNFLSMLKCRYLRFICCL